MLFVILTFYYIDILLYVTKATTCINKYEFIRNDSFSDMIILNGRLSTKSGVSSRTECAVKCDRYDKCISFFYNSDTKKCHLNSVNYMSTDGSEPERGTTYHRRHVVCPAPPTFEKANLVYSASGPYLEGDELEFQCAGGYMANDLITKTTCQSDETWSSVTCSPIQSCSQVHRCNNSYPDDHYWIYPPALERKRVKIYCHHLSSEATEYVSLLFPNHVNFPNLFNIDCGGEQIGRYDNNQYPGMTYYNKARVNIETLEVIRGDATFTHQVFGYILPYGVAWDCYTQHRGQKSACGPRGSATVDLTGTGFKVDPQMTYKQEGYRSWMQVVRNAENTKIDLLCGGWPGGCIPDGPMFLKFNEPEEPPEDSAVIPSCVYP